MSIFQFLYFADAVSGAYGCPQNGDIAANGLDISDDIPEKSAKNEIYKNYQNKQEILK